jgi:hypothetical protein
MAPCRHSRSLIFSTFARFFVLRVAHMRGLVACQGAGDQFSSPSIPDGKMTAMLVQHTFCKSMVIA